MRISHTCARCGHELHRIAAPPDPAYGLRVVVCPRCHLASVRTRPALIAGWRRVRRAVRSWVALVMQGVAAALALLAAMPPVMMLEEWVTHDWHMTWPAFFGALTSGTLDELVRTPDATRTAARLLGFFVIGSVAAGAWTAAGLAHWRRAPALLAWGVLFAIVLSAEPITMRLIYLSGELREGDLLPLNLWGWRLVFAFVSTPIAFAGVPIGRLVRRLWNSQGPVLRARARRRLRQREGAHA